MLVYFFLKIRIKLFDIIYYIFLHGFNFKMLCSFPPNKSHNCDPLAFWLLHSLINEQPLQSSSHPSTNLWHTPFIIISFFIILKFLFANIRLFFYRASFLSICSMINKHICNKSCFVINIRLTGFLYIGASIFIIIYCFLACSKYAKIFIF